MLAEESGATGDSEYTWIIDPLDGTTNFIHGFPQYAVSIALRHREHVTQAVVYDPTRNELFTATRGRGAFMNERRIRVSSATGSADCLIGTGFPFRSSRASRRVRAHVQEHHRDTRPGSVDPALPRSTLPMSPPDDSTASGKSACHRGTWRPAAC